MTTVKTNGGTDNFGDRLSEDDVIPHGVLHEFSRTPQVENLHDPLGPVSWLRVRQFTIVLVWQLLFCVAPCFAQQPLSEGRPPDTNKQISVNWLYGSYVPKEVPLQPLNGQLRLRLYSRQTYTTWAFTLRRRCSRFGIRPTTLFRNGEMAPKVSRNG